ncbi:LysR family transcriptional regulator [Paludibacterium yongneupense]|uniref:LysR family transcriptional regulator n=1 Tax=Paludibacterium yongneupense TaxID=400061 RepID=UPI0003FAD8F8|nr:LysR family transcriptional regulator [Paludibacterium yongneupense]
MKLHQLDLNLLLAFDALLEHGSVTRAAEQLYISQPAMSHALNRLRQFFDDPLLVRSQHGMLPTARALKLHPGIRHALRLLEQHLNEPEEFEPQTSSRRFVICTTDYVECVLIPPLIERLERIAPGLRIEILILRDRVPEAELANGAIDLVLGFDEYMDVPGHLCRETWLTEPLAGVVSARHPAAGSGLSLAQLIAIPHVFHSPLGTRTSTVDRYLERHGVQRTISVNSQSYMSAAAIVSHTEHLLILPQRVAALLCSTWPLRRVGLPADLPAYHLNCVWHPVQDKAPALCWLRGLMQSLIET